MKNQEIVLSSIDLSTLSYLINQITGIEGASDTTELLWQNGSIHGTVPATPSHLRGAELFKHLKHLPPIPKFSGRMNIHRQGGEVKTITI
jgi:hypothetical protein